VSPPDAARDALRAVFADALAAVEPGAAVRRALGTGGGRPDLLGWELGPGARVVVLAVGKAAAPMAAALEAAAGERVVAGLAITREGHEAPLARTRLLLAGHPVPDARSERAAREALRLVESTRPDDLLVVLLSGGASSLLAGPAPGLALADLARTTDALLAAGAPIDELNAVRKHCSAVAGGRLARRARAARIACLVLSDVPGDRLDVIGSGPCAPDPTRYADALAALARRGARVPERVRAHLRAGARGEIPETPKPGDPALARVRTALVATNATARAAAVSAAARRGWRALDLGGGLCGEARRAGRRLAGLAGALRAPEPVCLVAGGETTVTLGPDPGRGGRSQEAALAAALALAGRDDALLLFAGTDGSDGPTDAAGAYADGSTVARGRARGRDARADLARHDAYGFFGAEGGLLRTGPTRTNVMDLAFVHVNPRPGAASKAL